MKMEKKKRWTAFVLACFMIVSSIPWGNFTAQAESFKPSVFSGEQEEKTEELLETKCRLSVLADKGSVRFSGNEKKEGTAEAEVLAGETVTFTILPEEGKYLEKIEIQDAGEEDKTVAFQKTGTDTQECTATMEVTKDVTLLCVYGDILQDVSDFTEYFTVKNADGKDAYFANGTYYAETNSFFLEPCGQVSLKINEESAYMGREQVRHYQEGSQITSFFSEKRNEDTVSYKQVMLSAPVSFSCDNKAPTINRILFPLDQEANDRVQEEVYGYYFKESTTVSVYAADEGSGVKSVTYRLEDITNGTNTGEAAIDENGVARFTIPANFKGRLFVKACDNLNHESAEKEPDKIIVESQSMHDDKEHGANVLFTFPKAAGQIENRNIYKEGITVPVTVKDGYSGLKRVDWSLSFNGGEILSETVSVNDDGTFTDEESNWSAKKDLNLVTELSREIICQDLEGIYTLSVTLEDHAGFETTKTEEFCIDKSAPEIKVTYSETNKEQIYKNPRTAQITVKEENFDPQKVVFHMEGAELLASDVTWTESADKKTHTASVTFDKEGSYRFRFTVTDAAGVSAVYPSSGSDEFVVDLNGSEVENFKIHPSDASSVMKYQKTGDVRWYNQDVSLSFDVSDSVSGLRNVKTFDIQDKKVTGQLTGHVRQSYDENPSKDKESFSGISAHTEEGETQIYKMRILSEDAAGNQTKSDSVTFGIDRQNPEITVNQNPADEWTNRSIEVSFQASDMGSGIAAVYYAKGTPSSYEDAAEVSAADGNYIVTFQKEDENGAYVCWAEDQLGNQSDFVSFEIKIDQTAPKINGIVFTSEDLDDVTADELGVTETSYGYAFQNAAKVVVHASDDLNGSGVSAVKYRLLPESGSKIVQDETAVYDSQAEGYSFDILAGFKGQIFVYAVDKAGNSSTEARPNGVIVESKEQHDSNAGVELKFPDTKDSDCDGNPLYSGESVLVNIIAEDTYTGIAEAEWVLKTPEGAEIMSGRVEVEKNGSLSDESWTKTKDTASNLITKLEKNVSIFEEGNAMTLTVRLIDWAGYETTEQHTFSIDNTKPQVALACEDVHTDSNHGIFNKDHTITIQVSDWNLDYDETAKSLDGTEVLVHVYQNGSVGNETDSVKARLEWVKLPDTQVPSYQALLTFTDDGLYHVSVLSSDLAQNESEEQKDTFTLDTQKPEWDMDLFSIYPEDNTASPYESGGISWYSENIYLSFAVQDTGCGLKTIIPSDADFTHEKKKQFAGCEEFSNDYPLGEFESDSLSFGFRGETNQQEFPQGARKRVRTDVRDKETGVYKLKLNALDYAGNFEQIESKQIGVDKTKPTITPDLDPQGWTNQDVTVTFLAEDNDSGIKEIYCAPGDTKPELVTGNYKIEPEDGSYQKTFDSLVLEGEYTFCCWTVDNVGNESEAVPFSVRIDKTNPAVIGMTFSKESSGAEDEKTKAESIQVQETNYGYFFQENTLVTVNVEDKKEGIAQSGVKQVSYRLEAANLLADSQESPSEIAGKSGTADVENDSASFVVPAGFKGQIYVRAKDYAENLSEEAHPNGIIVENQTIHDKYADIQITMPQSTTEDAENHPLYHGNIQIPMEVQDTYTGLREVNWTLASANKETLKSGTVSIDENGNLSESGWTSVTGDHADTVLKIKNETGILIDGVEGNSMVFTVTLIDRAGFTSEYKRIFSIDKTAPTVEFTCEEEHTQENQGMFGRTHTVEISVSDWNLDYNEQTKTLANVDCVIMRTDGTDASQIQIEEQPKLTWEKKPSANNNGKMCCVASISFEKEGFYRLQCSAADKTDYQSDVCEEAFLVDKKAAAITDKFTLSSAEKTDALKKPYDEADTSGGQTVHWYGENVKFSFSTEDKTSGLHTVSAKAAKGYRALKEDMEESYETREYFAQDTDGNTISFGVRSQTQAKTYEVQTEGDGIYRVLVNVEDYAQNPSEKESDVIGVDKTKPEITSVTFSAPKEYKEGEWNPQNIEETKYGFYFQENTTVTIKAKDIEKNGSMSDLASISYGLKKKGDTEFLDTEVKKITAVSGTEDEYQISFEVPANFKGSIHAYAADHVGNQSKIVQPDAVIVEDAAKHDTEGTIGIALPNTDSLDAKGQKLYKEQVLVPITVTDTYSGLREISWSVQSKKDENQNQEGTVVIDNNGGLLGDKEGVAIDERENNLAIRVSKTLTVKNNSNDITLTVKMKDRTGMEKTETVTFSIDTSAPEISIVYEPKSSDTSMDNVYKAFYKEDRKAHITVKERNFDENQATAEILKSLESADDVFITEWTDEDELSGIEDTAAQTCTITFQGNNAYNFSMGVTDMAGNETQYQDGESDIFMVDKEKPTVKVQTNPNQWEVFEEESKMLMPVVAEGGGLDMKEYQDGSQVYWYNQDVSLPFSVEDTLSGLYQIRFSDLTENQFLYPLNKKELTYQPLKEYSKDGVDFGKRGEILEQVFAGETKVQTNGDGAYRLQIHATDYAGNESLRQSQTIGVDTTAPWIESIAFSGEGNADSGIFGQDKHIERMTYGYYFREKTTVTVTACDQPKDSQTKVPVSEVKSITYYMEEIDGTRTKPVTKDVNEKNQISFEVEADFKGQIYVYAADHVGNFCEEVQPDGVIAESEATHKEHSKIFIDLPTTGFCDIEGNNLYDAAIDIPVTVQDFYSGLREVKWTVTSEYDKEKNQKKSVTITNSGELQKDKDGWEIKSFDDNLATELQKKIHVPNNSNQIKLEVTLTDRAGFTLTESVVFSIDTTKPVVSAVYDNNKSDSMDASWKEFYAKDRKATLTVIERNFNESCANLLIQKAVPNSSAAIQTDWKDEGLVKDKNFVDQAAHIYTCEIPYQGNSAYHFKFDVIDFAGNKTEYKNGASDIFVVDKAAPALNKNKLKVHATKQNEVKHYTDEKGVVWYNQNVRFAFTAQDTCAGLYQVKSGQMTGNQLTGKFRSNINTKYSLSDYTINAVDFGKRGQTAEQNYNVYTNTKANKSEKYRMEITAKDYAGNENSIKSNIVGIDLQKPRITGILFTGEGNQDSKWKSKAVNERYGYYFREATTVKITATDVNENGSSGLKSISYRLVDVTDKKAKAFQTPKLKTEKDEQYITFEIPAGFKGRIYAYATDYVGNQSDTEQPDGTIRESEEQKKDVNIQITAPETSFKDEEGLPLYASDTTVHLSVEDTHSGIRQIEWSVESDEDSGSNQSGKLTVENDGTLSGDNWQATGKDRNLVTKLERNLTIKNNSNNIKIKVKFTDRAGNETEYKDGKGEAISIDKSKPEIDVKYQETNPSNEVYFNKDQVVEITVTERNFDEEATNRQIQITNTDGSVPTVGSWTHGGEKGTDGATHTTQITFSDDGDYTFAMKATDLAENTEEYNQNDEFTIDQTNPEIEVSYSTGGLSNNIYYKEECVATITVTEHNFDPSGVVVTQIAELDGQSVSAPSAGGWSSSGDVHTASIHYDSDGDYTLSVACSDLATNEAENYAGTKFVVDRTEPEIEITDIEDQTAYNGTVAPAVSFGDVNCDENSVKITLKGLKHSEKDLTGSLTRQTHGGSIKLEDFAHEADLDDIYTLTAEVSDLAGNSARVSKVFSVNRFGSNYELAKDTKKLISDYYSRKEEDLVITETNVSTLKENGITYSKNGELVTLEKGKDYEVKDEGTEYASWKKYTYTIYADNFIGEGSYIVTIHSIDGAENNMTNRSAKTKEYTKKVEFVIDKTAPQTVITGVDNNMQYMESERDVRIDSQDNIALKEVGVYLNDKGDCAFTWNPDLPTEEREEFEVNDGMIRYAMKSASHWQNLRVVSVDKAGNRKESDTIRCLLTPNILVQFINNRPLFFGTLSFAAIAAVLIYFILAKRKKKEEA